MLALVDHALEQRDRRVASDSSSESGAPIRVLSGGTTLAANFGQHLLKELRLQAPTHTKVKITAPVERIYSKWVGGSILACLSTMQGVWISKAQYQEAGEGILRVKPM